MEREKRRSWVGTCMEGFIALNQNRGPKHENLHKCSDGMRVAAMSAAMPSKPPRAATRVVGGESQGDEKVREVSLSY